MRDIKDYQEKYKDEPFEQYQVFFRRKKVLELLDKYPHHNLLEVGCGLNPLFTDIDIFETMTIVEPATDFIHIAKEKAAKRKEIHCIQGFLEERIKDIQRLKIEFDYIVVSGLLHEVESPELLLKSLYMLCGEDTVVHINVPNALSFHRIIAFEMGVIESIYQRSEMQDMLQQKQRTYDLNSIRKTVEEAGFEILEEGTYFPKFLSHMQLQKAMDAGIIDTKILDGIYYLGEYVPQYGSELYVQLRKRVDRL